MIEGPGREPAQPDDERIRQPGRDPARRRPRWLALPTLLGVLIAGICAAFVGRALVSQWSQVREDIVHASPAWLLAGLVLAFAAMTWIALCWREVLAVMGDRVDRRRTVAWYFAGEIAKYVPGGVWALLGRGELARRGGVPGQRAYPSVALSLVSLYLAALAVAVVLVPLDLAKQVQSPVVLVPLICLPLGLVALHPRVLTPLRDLVVRRTGRGSEIPIPPWGATLLLVTRYLPGWMLIWAATWCVARALVPDPSVLRIGIATTLAWTAGFLAVPVPAGAAVREAVFTAAAGMAAGPAATVAVASRLVFLLADVAGAALTSLWHRTPGPTDGGSDTPGDPSSPERSEMQAR